MGRECYSDDSGEAHTYYPDYFYDSGKMFNCIWVVFNVTMEMLITGLGAAVISRSTFYCLAALHEDYHDVTQGRLGNIDSVPCPAEKKDI
jgi:hypothetical protein